MADPDTPHPLTRYDAMCDAAAAEVIATYSTSFSLATRLLPPRQRRDIRNLYAMVRIADEIVDGAAHSAGRDVATTLGAYESAVLAAPDHRFHPDPVLHAYAASARRCDFDPEHVRSFFASMRRDVTQTHHDAASFDAYVYGSAEVIGLLCLSVFLAGREVDPAERAEMERGARTLGSAFQKINFLRDFHEDHGALGRLYFPALQDAPLDDALKTSLISDIRTELDAARAAIPLLPLACRPAVAAAEALFRDLADALDATPAAALAATRVRLSAHRKLLVTARAAARVGARRG
ncbi:15-cis-phytoene synthase [Corynebacterium auris]|nr:15-cis-phytoene synthase [Corynebacterium auris]